MDSKEGKSSQARCSALLNFQFRPEFIEYNFTFTAAAVRKTALFRDWCESPGKSGKSEVPDTRAQINVYQICDCCSVGKYLNIWYGTEGGMPFTDLCINKASWAEITLESSLRKYCIIKAPQPHTAAYYRNLHLIWFSSYYWDSINIWNTHGTTKPNSAFIIRSRRECSLNYSREFYNVLHKAN